MTIRHLRIFVMVAECGTMSMAAEKMFLAQPTVSQAVRELEAHYGGLLFERMSKHLYITPSGEKLLGFARELLRQYDELEERMADDRQKKKLRLGATLTIGTCLLPGMIESFRARVQGVDIFSCVNNTRVIEEKLLDARLDLGLVEGKIRSTDLVSEPVIEDELVMVCSGSHPLAGREEIRFSELQGRRFVFREQGSGTREMFEKDLKEHQVGVTKAWEVIGTEAVKHAVLRDECLSVISFRLVEEEVRGGQMYMFRRDARHWKRKFSLVYHKDKYVNDTMRNFMDNISETGNGETFWNNSCGWITADS